MPEGENYPVMGRGMECLKELEGWRRYRRANLPAVCPKCGPGAWVLVACLVGAGLVVVLALVLR